MMKNTVGRQKILMVCEAFGGGVFTYVSQLCNDMCDDFDVSLTYSLRPQTPKNYKEFSSHSGGEPRYQRADKHLK